MKSRKPSIWIVKDFLFYGLTAIAVTVLGIYLLISGPIVTLTGSVVTLEASLLIFSIASFFWFAYFSLVYGRYSFQKKFTIETKHGMFVNPNGYHITKNDLEHETDKILDLYETKTPINARKHLEKEVLYVTFVGELIDGKKLGYNKKLFGFVSITDSHAHVSYATTEGEPDPFKPLQRTAFEHEIGHIILGRATGSWNNESHHAFMKSHGLR